MGDLINLRRARKSKLRTEKDAQASENRAKFGRTLSQIKQQATLAERNNKSLDGHLLSSSKDKPE